MDIFLSTLDIIRHEPILSGIAVLLLYSFIRTTLLSRRITRLTKGSDGKTLEGTIKKLQDRVDVLEAYARSATQKVKAIDARVETSIRGVAVEHFDPFQNAGGQQSFATALLNEKGDGVVVSGIHSRDGVRVYTKPIEKFSSARELSEEETQAVKQAQKTLA